MLEKFVEMRVGRPMLGGCAVGLLELAEDFGFADHHGIQSAGHSKKVLHAG